jgi:PAS domain S-box-containing protein
MLRDYAKTSPVTFFALPIIIIGLLILSYFLYSTFITNQIDARSAYLNRQLQISIEKINRQVKEFNDEVPFLTEIDDFNQVFDENSEEGGKLRYRIKHLSKRYHQFIDTIFIYDSTQVYFINTADKGRIVEGMDKLDNMSYPLQFTRKPKMVHVEGNKSLAIVPTNLLEGKKPVYVAALVDVFGLAGSVSGEQFIGDHGCKLIFSENLGFRLTEKGQSMNYEFGLNSKHRRKVVNSLLKHEGGNLIHSINRNEHVFLTVYQPFEIFTERFGLIFCVSDEDFIEPIRNKLQIIFLSFFLIIAIIIVVFVINLRDIGQNTDELEQSRAGLARALVILEAQQENYRDGLLIVDEHLKVISFNKKLLELFNFSSKPFKGMKLEDLVGDLVSSCAECAGVKRIESLAKEELSQELSEEIILKNGNTYDFYTSPIHDEVGNVYGRLWMFRDVTDRKREIEELKQANFKAQEGAREKENFLSTMSHEIRTPLNSIVGFANLLLDENPRPDQIEQLQPLKYSADSLLNLINDILDLTKMEGGHLELEMLDFSLNQKLQTAQQIFAQQAKQKGLTLELDLDEQIATNLVGDYNRLNQVVFNLLSNAIKFTASGKVTLGSKLVNSSESQECIKIFVQDSGIGIDSRKLDLIFESFSQADSNTTRKFGGTGLGLAIVKKLTEIQGGTVGVDSKVNKGSTFWVEISYKKTTISSKNLVAESSDRNLKNKTFLVVEDNPFNQKVVQKFLDRWGAQSTLVSSGEEALETLKHRTFNAVLMDLQMPGMDGYETALEIRSLNSEANQVKIIAMSADALGEVQEKVKQANMNGYISKPFNPSEHLDLLATL